MTRIGTTGTAKSRIDPETVETAVMRRTGGRLRQLTVLVEGDLVVLQGFSMTYYVKQLASSAVKDLGHKVRNDIAVSL